MNHIEFKGRLGKYFLLPQIMTIVFAVGTIYLFTVNRQLGLASALITILYFIVSVGIYHANRRAFSEELINFATSYGTMQKEFLDRFQLPYALLDANGRFLWQNQRFCQVTGHDKYYSKSITAIFPEITRELLDKNLDDFFEIRVPFGEQVFNVQVQRVPFGQQEGEDRLITAGSGMDQVITVLLLDETELDELTRSNEEQKLVAGLLYIDNYDETLADVEEVRRSMLTAVIDRNVNRYFQDSDAIVRRLDRDKYFVIFQYRYLKKLEEDRFSILEDMKKIKVGNDRELTVSMGIGLNGGSYQKNAEYARAAIDIALGRGGSQVVIKDNGNVSYYGVRGKEIERSTRVKARVKAQALRELMETRDRILISDIDVLGASIAVFVAARHLGKKCHIVLDTITNSLRPFISLFSEDEGYPEDMFISSEQALVLLNSRTLVMVVDTNRPNYTECPELLRRSSNVIVFDHHRQGAEKIEAPILSYIEPYASSTCEMLAEVLQYFDDDVQISPSEADAIYAGILIDTNNFMTKTGVRTFEAAAYLRRNGADVIRVRKLLREDMTAYKARAEVVRNARVYRGAFAISVCDPGDLESPTIVGAQAANELLNIVGIKASFVLTEFQKKIYVSSRSIDEIDVQLVMERLGGGGHLNVAGAQVEGSTVEEVIKRIQDILDVMIEEGEIKL